MNIKKINFFGKIIECVDEAARKSIEALKKAATQTEAGLMSTADKKKLDGIAAGAQVNSVTGVKGSAESAYRSGNVNLTAANVGAAASNHNHDSAYAAKSHSHNYAASNHSHSEYAPANHSHSNYAASNHTHTAAQVGAAASNHSHSEYASKSVYGDGNINCGRKSGTSVQGWCMGGNMEVTSRYGFGTGLDNTAGGEWCSFVSGWANSAAGNYSACLGGYDNTAAGRCSVVIGQHNIVNGNHAVGMGEGISITDNHVLVCGYYNVDPKEKDCKFAVGGGTPDARSNAFSVQYDGTIRAKGTYTASTAADYAEFFEWADGNLSGEDRVGLFVTLDGDKIRIAGPDDGYILGIISGRPFVLGNGDCYVWNGAYLYDEFNRPVMEPAPKLENVYVSGDGEAYVLQDDELSSEKMSELKIASLQSRQVFDADGNPVYEGVRHKLNPEYDKTREYISREDRPEWDAVGMLGVLSVVQDGTLKVNGYCMCGENGVATACDIPGCGYRVTEIINDRVAKAVFREALPVSAGRKLQNILDNAGQEQGA